MVSLYNTKQQTSYIKKQYLSAMLNNVNHKLKKKKLKTEMAARVQENKSKYARG